MKKLFLISLTVVMAIMFGSVAMAQPPAPDENVLNGCYKKINGQLRIVSSPAECYPSEISVSWNIVGPEGQAEPEEPAGSNGVVETYALGGSIGVIGGRTLGWVFAGPTVNVSTTDLQRITAVVQAPLGTWAGGTASFGYDLCYRLAGSSDALTNFSGSNRSVGEVSFNSGRLSFTAAASVVPGAGTWEVGYCIFNWGSTELNNNHLISGWVMVTN